MEFPYSFTMCPREFLIHSVLQLFPLSNGANSIYPTCFRGKVRLLYPGKCKKKKYKTLLFSKKFQHISPGEYEQRLKGQADWIHTLETSFTGKSHNLSGPQFPHL